MKKIIAFMKKTWERFGLIASSNAWKLIFPMAAFIAIAIISHSLSAVIAFAIWVLTFVANTDEAD